MNSQASAAQPAAHKSNIPQVLAHSPKDNVAVVVVEDLKAGTKAFGVVTEDNSTFTVDVKDDVPIGHKVALIDRVALGVDGTPAEWRRSLCRTDQSHYLSDLK